jgi:hypothetical protein
MARAKSRRVGTCAAAAKECVTQQRGPAAITPRQPQHQTASLDAARCVLCPIVVEVECGGVGCA